MEYIYAALLLHSAEKPIEEESVQAVLSAAGIAVNESRVKALIAALDGVDVEEAISKAAAAPVAAAAAAPVAAAAAPAEEEEEEEKKEEEEESGMAGLGALFG
ncbi:50S ribosomal protein L12 [Methanocalculus chunghsingensis]|uniref:Large ribosomal subunit protein P1 n=1 Tax=Methanocalculus chunghsingensis TaxID=156457 RepID=A0A8J8B510_9EURY|nr:50S ribosomal protein P1 [Methanocalculus chunghsingensis]MBR1368589.1 50S ribosomal protein L12 [Methanocalculus chunghsingensis]